MGKRSKEYFTIAGVSRHDLIAVGYDAAAVDDGTMQRLSGELEDAYLAGGFWHDLREIAGEMGIPKRAAQ